MKLFALCLLAPLASAWKQCGTDHHPSVMNAIGRFCQKQDIVVPSKYASDGLFGFKGGDNNGHIWITGNCNPPQWIPRQYCMSQFTNMCNNGATTIGHGNNGCQTWHIAYAPAPKKAAPKADPNFMTVHL